MSVVDFHVRLPPVDGFLDRASAVLESAGIESAVLCAGGVIDREELSRHLVDGGFITDDPDNDVVVDAAAGSAGRYMACWFGNPHRSPDRYRENAHRAVGLELSPAVHGVPLDDPRIDAWIVEARRARHWVYIVAIHREGCDVQAVVDCARRYPDVSFVLGHLGYGNIDYHGMSLASSVHNIFVESSGGYTSVLADAVEKLGAERVLFGSEFPLQHPEVELAKVHSIGLQPSELEAVLGGNARRIGMEMS